MESCLREQVKTALEICNVKKATFLAERLHASHPSQENTILLAKCYTRDNKEYRACYVLEKCGELSLQGRLLLAQSAIKCNKLEVARTVIIAALNMNIPEQSYLLAEFHYLYGILLKKDENEVAKQHFLEALKLDLLHWPAFEELCKFGKSEEAKVYLESLEQIANGQLDMDIIQDEEMVDNYMVVDTPGEAKVTQGTHGDRIWSRLQAAVQVTRRPMTEVCAEAPSGKLRRVDAPAGSMAGKQDCVTSTNDTVYYSAEEGLSDSQSMSHGGENPTQTISPESSQRDMYSMFFKLHKGFYLMSIYDNVEDNEPRALDMFGSLPEGQRNSAWVKSKRACIYMQQGLNEMAKNLFNEARMADQCQVEDMDVFSSVLYLMSEHATLLLLKDTLRQIDDKCPETWLAIGNFFSLMKQHEKALMSFQRAIQLDATHSYAYSLCGYAYLETEQYDEALSCFTEAVKHDSRHQSGWYGQGLVRFHRQEYELAAEFFRKAVEINPQHTIFRLRYAIALSKRKLYDEALEQLDRALFKEPHNKNLLLQKGKIEFECRKFNESKETLLRAKAEAQADPEVHYYLGLVHKKLNETIQASEVLNEALTLDPGSELRVMIQGSIDRINLPDNEEQPKY